jgi:hypothetical protein
MFSLGCYLNQTTAITDKTITIFAGCDSHKSWFNLDVEDAARFAHALAILIEKARYIEEERAALVALRAAREVAHAAR